MNPGIYVHFHQIDEFIAELKAHVPSAFVMRHTVFIRESGRLPISRLSVVATVRFNDTILRLEQACGESLGSAAETANALVGRFQQKLNAAAADLGMQVRAGVFSFSEQLGGGS